MTVTRNSAELSKKPYYGEAGKTSTTLRVRYAQAGKWVCQHRVAEKGTREKDNWEDLFRPTERAEALRQFQAARKREEGQGK